MAEMRVATQVDEARRALEAAQGGRCPLQVVATRREGGAPGAPVRRIFVTRIYVSEAGGETLLGFEFPQSAPFPLAVPGSWAETVEVRMLGVEGALHPYEGVHRLDP